MQLKCTIERVDFIPTIKFKGKVWQPKGTLVKGSLVDVEDELGHTLMAIHPGAFEVLGYGDAPKPRSPKKLQVDEKVLRHVDSGENLVV